MGQETLGYIQAGHGSSLPAECQVYSGHITAEFLTTASDLKPSLYIAGLMLSP